MTRRALVGLLGMLQGKRVEVIAHHRNRAREVAEAVALGVDWVEIDVRMASSGELRMAHDAEEVAGAEPLEAGLSQLGPRCGWYLDWKDAPVEAIAAMVKRAGLLRRCVVYGRYEKLGALQRLAPGIGVMPEAESVEHLREVLRELRPRVVAFDRRDFEPEIVQVAREARVGIFVDRLGREDTPDHWRMAVRMGATGIQTDRPDELITMLSSVNA